MFGKTAVAAFRVTIPPSPAMRKTVGWRRMDFKKAHILSCKKAHLSIISFSISAYMIFL
jgi:hypothetical protein